MAFLQMCSPIPNKNSNAIDTSSAPFRKQRPTLEKRSILALSSTVRKWLRYALDDLKVARAIGSMGSSYWRACAYHSQQAVEKALKGYLTAHKIRFAKTHDILVLLNAVTTIE